MTATATNTPTVTLTATITLTPTATAIPSAYRDTVLADHPISYWRLDETSGTTATDVQLANTGAYVGSPTLGQPGAIVGDPDTAVSFWLLGSLEDRSMACM